MDMKSVCIIAISVCLVSQASGSAIPMWEFLSRPEKASQLYFIYKKQVNDFCQTSTSPDCNKNYMVTGMQVLANMDDYEMDKLDPYQHGAKSLIWSKLSGDAAISRVAHEPDNSFYTNEADQQEKNEDLIRQKELYNIHLDDRRTHLTGPVVVRVLPDGRPVPGDEHTPAPRDDDLEEIKFEHIPSIGKSPQKSYKQPFLRAYVYQRKPFQYSRNHSPLNSLEYFRQLRNVNKKNSYIGLNEIPRYRPFFTFDHRF